MRLQLFPPPVAVDPFHLCLNIVDFPAGGSADVALQRVQTENGFAGLHSAGLDGLVPRRARHRGPAATPLGREAGLQPAAVDGRTRAAPQPRAAPALGRLARLAEGVRKGKVYPCSYWCRERVVLIVQVFTASVKGQWRLGQDSDGRQSRSTVEPVAARRRLQRAPLPVRLATTIEGCS